MGACGGRSQDGAGTPAATALDGHMILGPRVRSAADQQQLGDRLWRRWTLLREAVPAWSVFLYRGPADRLLTNAPVRFDPQLLETKRLTKSDKQNKLCCSPRPFPREARAICGQEEPSNIRPNRCGSRATAIAARLASRLLHVVILASSSHRPHCTTSHDLASHCTHE